MRTFVTDTQAVPSTSATLFDMIQQGPQAALVTIHNTGSITMNYTFQEHTGSAWSNLASASTLQGSEVKRVKLESDYPRIRMIGDAASPTTLAFSITRTYVRPSGGSMPLIAI